MEPKQAYEILKNRANLEDNVKQALLDVIKTETYWVYRYARDVIQGRWLEVEEIIKKSEWAYCYAKKVIGDGNYWRNQEALEEFMNNVPKSNNELDALKKQREELDNERKELDNKIKQLECA